MKSVDSNIHYKILLAVGDMIQNKMNRKIYTNAHGVLIRVTNLIDDRLWRVIDEEMESDEINRR